MMQECLYGRVLFMLWLVMGAMLCSVCLICDEGVTCCFLPYFNFGIFLVNFLACIKIYLFFDFCQL